MIALLSVCTVGGPLSLAQDKVDGAIWELFVKNPKTDKWETRSKFRCTTDGKVYGDGKVVGTHKRAGAKKVEIIVTEAKEASNNGTFKGTRVAKDSSFWEGTYTKKDGTELPIRLRLIAD
jgi:hypothetical protein